MRKIIRDSLKVSEFDVGADRQNSEPPVDYARLGEHVASVVKAAEVAAERITEEANLEAATTLSEADRVRAEAEEATKIDARRRRCRIRSEAPGGGSGGGEDHRVGQAGRDARSESGGRASCDPSTTHRADGEAAQPVGCGPAERRRPVGDSRKAEGLPVRSDEDQTNIREETLDETLRASIEA